MHQAHQTEPTLVTSLVCPFHLIIQEDKFAFRVFRKLQYVCAWIYRSHTNQRVIIHTESATICLNSTGISLMKKLKYGLVVNVWTKMSGLLFCKIVGCITVLDS